MKTLRCSLVLVLCGLGLSLPASADSNSLLSQDTFRLLTADRRAYKVGDVITVAIQESASATSAVDLDTRRRNAANVNVDPLQGASVSAGAGLTNDSSGAGRIQRTGRLLAQISVTITEVLPSGDFLISGEQHLDLNQEAQTIRLRGIVRPVDIDERNVVQSTRVSAADIQFVGNGFLSDAGRPGLLSRLLTFFGL